MKHTVDGGRALILAAALAAVGIVALPAVPTAAGAEQRTTPGAVTPIGAFTSGQPFSSGQVVRVQVPGNSVLGSGTSVRVVECSASILVASSDARAARLCDGTTIQGDTILTNPDGSFDYPHYTVYALPDRTSLGESPSSRPICDVSDRCVLYIGLDQLHPLTSAHLFSEPFSVTPTAGDTGAHPGSGGTDTGGSLLLPTLVPGLVVGLGAVVLVVVLRRRAGGPTHTSASRRAARPLSARDARPATRNGARTA
jgi:hypothetical protein